MSKVFRAWDVDEVWLFPASVQDVVPPGHIAHLIRETVREGLDLRAILSQYNEERGYPPYHPGMMTALLLYAYSQGIYSSRRIDRACHERSTKMHQNPTGRRGTVSDRCSPPASERCVVVPSPSYSIECGARRPTRMTVIHRGRERWRPGNSPETTLKTATATWCARALRRPLHRSLRGQAGECAMSHSSSTSTKETTG